MSAPSWHALAFTWAFRFSPAACRYVRSTSAASRRDAVRVGQLFISSSLCLPLKPASRIKLQIPSSKAFPHPYIPSPGPARTAQPSQKLREILFWSLKMRFFSLPKIILFFACVFSRKKMRKSRILTSQNHPQTLPKRLQNRCPKRHAIFHRFLFDSFLFFTFRFLENIDFP